MAVKDSIGSQLLESYLSTLWEQTGLPLATAIEMHKIETAASGLDMITKLQSRQLLARERDDDREPGQPRESFENNEADGLNNAAVALAEIIHERISVLRDQLIRDREHREKRCAAVGD